jgi:hypothetical protein
MSAALQRVGKAQFGADQADRRCVRVNIGNH